MTRLCFAPAQLCRQGSLAQGTTNVICRPHHTTNTHDVQPHATHTHKAGALVFAVFPSFCTNQPSTAPTAKPTPLLCGLQLKKQCSIIREYVCMYVCMPEHKHTRHHNTPHATSQEQSLYCTTDGQAQT